MGVLAFNKDSITKYFTKNKKNIQSNAKKNVANEVTERLFIRRYSTSLIESLVRSAITLNGIVLSSDGRL